MPEIRYGFYMLAELLLRLCIHPRFRAACLRLLGARVGTNVRIYECRFINVRSGFRGLRIGDNVHIGADCLIDLEGPVSIGRGSTLSPRIVVMSHSDPGSAHGSPWCESFPVESKGVMIGEDCWIGASATLLSGAVIGNRVVVGAGALVRDSLLEGGVYAGVPSRRVDR
jgi:acetyltransferase-like isoleucine patch superfamily enzyme